MFVILYRNGKGFEKKILKINEAYVVWKITIEFNKSHEIEANKSKPEEQEIPSKSQW
jgi:hypothetical protein